MQKKLKLTCAGCGETIECDDSVLVRQLACGSCDLMIDINCYPQLVKLKQERDRQWAELRRREQVEEERKSAAQRAQLARTKAERAARLAEEENMRKAIEAANAQARQNADTDNHASSITDAIRNRVCNVAVGRLYLMAEVIIALLWIFGVLALLGFFYSLTACSNTSGPGSDVLAGAIAVYLLTSALGCFVAATLISMFRDLVLNSWYLLQQASSERNRNLY